MNSQYPWAQGLQIAPDQIEAWVKELPRGFPLLKWCLEKAYIPEDRYLLWAANHYQLPYVNRDFFQQLPLGVAGVRKLLGTSPLWTEQYFPIHEWEGVVFIGCLEPPQNLPGENLRPLLAPASELSKLWKRLHDPEASLAPKPVPTPAPTLVGKPADKRDPTSILASESTQTGSSPLPLRLEVPEGLKITPEKVVSAPSNGPAGLKLDLETPVDTETQAPEGLKLNIKSASKPQAESTPQRFSKPPEKEMTATNIKLSLNSEATSVKLNLNPEIKAQPMTAKPQPTTVATAARSESMEGILAKFAPTFDRGMILLVQQGKLKPWKWVGAWKLANATPQEIPLDKPSVFKIVSDTHMPYHGYVVGSAVNNKFYQDWTGGAVPAHMTIVPLLSEGTLFGMVLGTAVVDPQPISTLFLAEKISMECSQFLAKNPKAA